MPRQMVDRAIKIKSKRDIFFFTSAIIVQVYFLFIFFSQPNIAKAFQPPEVWQGAIQLVILAAIYLFLQFSKLRPAHQMLVLALIFLSYFRIHNADLYLLVAFIYLETILLVGQVVRRHILPGKFLESDKFITSFLLGTLFLSVLFLFFGLLGFGGIQEIQVVCALLATTLIITNWRNSFAWWLYNAYIVADRNDRLRAVLILIPIVLVATRIAYVADHDSFLYGYRPELVLFDESSIFNSYGLIQGVFYYPKLYELLMAPISSLGSYNFYDAFGVVNYIFLAYLVYWVVEEAIENRALAMYSAAAVISIPAFGNFATTAKPDIFVTSLFAMATFYLVLGKKEKFYTNFLLSVSCIGLALVSKVSALLYLPLWAFLVGVIFSFKLIEKRSSRQDVSNDGVAEPFTGVLMIFGASMLVVLALLYRTWSITGIPYIAPISTELFKFIGFQEKYPFVLGNLGGLKSTLSITEILRTLWTFSFQPSKLLHIRIAWPGHSFIIMTASVALLFFWKPFRKKLIGCQQNALHFMIIGASFVLALLPMLFMTKLRGGDGNYYLIPVTFILISSVVLFVKLEIINPKVIAFFLFSFIPVQILLTLVTGLGVHKGTGHFSTNMARNPINLHSENLRHFKKEGIADLYLLLHELNSEGEPCRVLFESKKLFRRLPCTAERLLEISHGHSALPIFADVTSLKKYFDYARVNYLILETPTRFEIIEKTFAEQFQDEIKITEYGKYKVYQLGVTASSE